jgi:ABC-2 type transport system permease protein
MLSDFWQTVSLVNPILYMVNAFRYGLLGISDVNLVAAYSIILLFITTLTAIALYLLKNGVGIKE